MNVNVKKNVKGKYKGHIRMKGMKEIEDEKGKDETFTCMEIREGRGEKK